MKVKIFENYPNLGRAAVVQVALKAGEVIADFKEAQKCHKHHLSIQIDEDNHVMPEGITQVLNHSCCPNVAVDCQDRVVRALRSIVPGEVLSFFYPSTEWEMESSFFCACGDSRCLGEIRGAKYLTESVLMDYSKGILSPYILEQLSLR